MWKRTKYDRFIAATNRLFMTGTLFPAAGGHSFPSSRG
jgi:hypothetical protein